MSPAQVIILAIGALTLASVALAMLAGRDSGKEEGRPKQAKGKESKKGAESSVEDIMPVASIAGHFAFMKDGSYRGYMLWPGRNQSLDTDGERMAKAMKDAAVLSTIDVKFALLKYPEKVSSSKQLELVDAAIEREKSAYFACSEGDPEREVHRRKLGLLEGRLREGAVRESFGRERVNWPTYLVFCFPAKHDINLADQMMRNVQRLAADTLENPPVFLDEAGIRHLYQLFFTPETVSDVSQSGFAVLPEYGMFAQKGGRNG